jgi:hypothetical protein
VTPESKLSSEAQVRWFLQRVRNLVYRLDARRASTYSATAVLAVAVLLPLSAALLVPGRAGPLALLTLGGLLIFAALAVGTTLGFVVPRKKFGRDVQMAAWIGTRVPALASDLVSSVELTDAERLPRRGQPSSALVAAHVGAIAEKVSLLEPVELAQDRTARHAPLLVASLLLLQLAVVIGAPGFTISGWKKLLTRPRLPYAGAHLSSVPLVGDLEITLTHPAYSQRPPTVLPSSSGDFRAMPGTQVELKTRVLDDVRAAEILLDSGDGAPTTLPVTLQDGGLTASWVVDSAMSYRIATIDALKRRSVEARARTIEIELDRAPAVQLFTPGDELDVTNLRRIELAYSLEDDFGVTAVELVWRSSMDTGRRSILPSGDVVARLQGKLVWDMADVPLPPGAHVTYWLEARDNDTVGGPNLGKSKEYKLRVFSARERHELNVGLQQEVADKVLLSLGERLPGVADTVAARTEANRRLDQIVVEMGTLLAAYERDPLASKNLRADIGTMRDRVNNLASAETRALDKLDGGGAKTPRSIAARFTGNDARLIAELEDDLLTLADWLERERMETLLDISDEIAGHQKRLQELMDQYARTKDPTLKAEMARELATLESRLRELGARRGHLSEDVLDRFVHREAFAETQTSNCLGEVKALLAANQIAAAQDKLKHCTTGFETATDALEQSLAGFRRDRFSDEQRAFDEILDELADVTADQQDITGESDRIFDRYALRVDDLARRHGRDAQKRISLLVDRLKAKVEEVPENGLTPFADEELDIVRRRIDDIQRMLADGDLAEAEAMARQARTSLEEIAEELRAALDEDPASEFAQATAVAADAIAAARPRAQELVEELAQLSPSPAEILDDGDKRALERLRRRQTMNQERTRKLAEKAAHQGARLPGMVGSQLGKQLSEAQGHMKRGSDRMGAMDPGGARQEARTASDVLSRARKSAQGAAREQQRAVSSDEPIRIPGAGEYRAPARFREEIMEAMKRLAPSSYDREIRRYYEELVR